MAAELSSIDYPCLLVAEYAAAGSYRTYWHYRARRVRGMFILYEDCVTVPFHVDAHGASALEAANAALPHADAAFRRDADRCPGSLEFDFIEPNSEATVRRRVVEGRVRTLVVLLALVLVIAATYFAVHASADLSGLL